MDQVSEFRLSYLATSFTATGSLENSQAHSYFCLFSDGIFWVFSPKHMNLLGQEEKIPPPRCRNDVPFRFHHVLLLAPWRTQRTGCFFCFFWVGGWYLGAIYNDISRGHPKKVVSVKESGSQNGRNIQAKDSVPILGRIRLDTHLW